jgi:hypothetical protein
VYGNFQSSIMSYLNTSRVGAAIIVIGALGAGSGFAQQYRPGAVGSNPAAPAVIQQQQQQLNQQQMYNQGQAAIQGGTQAHAQSQQTLSTMSERNQAQLDAQTPHYQTSPTTTGDLH